MADSVYDSLGKYFDRGPLMNGLPIGVDEYLTKNTAGNPAVAAAEKQFDKVSDPDTKHTAAQFANAYRALEAAEIKALGFPSADAAVNFIGGTAAKPSKRK